MAGAESGRLRQRSRRPFKCADNAELNNVSGYFDDVARLENGFDLMPMADVLYDQSNYPLLQMAKSLTQTIIVADSVQSMKRRHPFSPGKGLTYPNIGEFDEFRHALFSGFLFLFFTTF